MSELDVAIVGMNVLLPGASDIREFWNNLVEAKCALEELDESELEVAGVDPEEFRQPNYVRVGAKLPGVDRFDNAFFGISDREARLMDPQHRMLLEFGWKAFEDAGYDVANYPGRVGVYAGLSLNTYLARVLLGSPEVDLGRDAQAVILGNSADYAATRLSYLLDLRGPSLTVQSACSTALVAVHEACQGLLSFQADMALAGACSLTLPNPRGYLYHRDSFFSPDGRVRAFDAKAAGTVFSNGVALVVLKRREDAERDGDFIHALIKGSAVNNDGADKVGYVAPSVRGQARVIRDALEIAGVGPDEIEYIEAHGTGTELGDPVEIRALSEAYRASTPQRQFCAIGSVKTNVGHTDVAAGAVGLIKTALALEHRVVPASLGFESPNPRLELDSSPFFVNGRTRAWESRRGRRLAGVSSFGIGGTNAHVILEEAGPRPPRPCRRESYCLTLSARTEEALRALVAEYTAYLAADPRHDWADICYTSNLGRRAFRYRHAVDAQDLADGRKILGTTPIVEAPTPERVLTAMVEPGGLDALANALEPVAPDIFKLSAKLDVADSARLLTAYLVVLLQGAGVAVRTRDAVVALPDAPRELRELLRQEANRFAGTQDSAPSCSLCIHQDGAWLEADSGPRLSIGMPAPMGKFLTTVAGRAWQLGVSVDWKRFYAGEPRWRVPLPTYPFARRRHWVDRGGAGPLATKNLDVSQWFFRPVWRETATAVGPGSGLTGSTVLLVAESEPGTALASALAGARVVQVMPGDSFQALDGDRYRIALEDEHSYGELASTLAEAGAVPRYLIHALLVDDKPWRADGSGFGHAQAYGLNSLVFLLRQIAPMLLEGQRLSVAVAVSDFADLTGAEHVNPDKATVIGATRTFPSEYPAIDCRIVDIPPTDFAGDLGAARHLIAEFHAPVAPENEIVAIRGGRRWQQVFAKVPVPETCDSPVRAHGAYVILGGLGELGLNLSRYLAEHSPCHLVLIGSSEFVGRSEWDAWSAFHGPDHAYSKKIAALRAIEELGADVSIVRCDVADRPSLHITLDAIATERGGLDAIIHAAGIVENGMIAHKDVTRFGEVFRAKVRGTYNLLEYVAKHPGPKVILGSSMNSLVGGLGQIDNTASNAFVDAIALSKLAKSAGEVCAVNWGAISSARLAEPVVLPQFSDLSREHKKNHMSADEIRSVYDRILSWSFGPRLVVSTIDLGVVLKRWGEVSRVTELTRLRRVADDIAGTNRSNDEAQVYRSALHRFVVETWSAILGLETIDWDDDLFALGAHSLSAVQFSSMLKDSFGLRLHAMGLYEFPRVGALVEYLQKLLDEKEAKAALAGDAGGRKAQGSN